MTQVLPPDPLVRAVARLVGLALFAGLLGAGVGVIYRWYARERVPDGIAMLVGLSSVALFLQTTSVLGQFIGGTTGLLSIDAVLFNTTTLLVAGSLSVVGGRSGDRLVTARLPSLRRGGEKGVSRLIRSSGHSITVELPNNIDDIEGYDPVTPDLKQTLTEQTFTFPRGLTVRELRERLVERLRDDYGVGRVDIEVTEDGTIEYLAVGSRVAGLGPTLAPESVAMAIHADPANTASPGDRVQVWTDSPPEQVLTAEIRTTVGDIVTLVIDESQAGTLDSEQSYRLMTLPYSPRPEWEFAGLLRGAEETMGVVTVEAESQLKDQPMSAVDATVVAVRGQDGALETIPPRSRVISEGDTMYLIARPERLRQLENMVASVQIAAQ